MSLNKIVIAIAFLALFVYTNPTIEAYEKFVRKEIIQKPGDQSNFMGILAPFFGGLLSNAVTNATIRTDFIFFSLYSTDLGAENTKVIGILNNFITMNSLKSALTNFSNSLVSRIKSTPDPYTQSVEFKDKFNTRETLRCMQEFYKEKQGLKKENLFHLKEWVGRYPTKSFGNEDRLNFFAIPEVERRLQQVLSKKDFENVTIEYGVEGPIELVDDYLLISRCKPHSCPENVLIAISVSDGSIFTMFSTPYSGYPHLFEKRCFATINGDLQLPKNIQERFLSES